MKHNIKRGDIYFVDFDETIGSVQSGLRPVVVIQNNMGNKHSTTLIVATITSKSKKKREMPTHIVVNVDGLAKESIIQLEQITTVDKGEYDRFVNCKAEEKSLNSFKEQYKDKLATLRIMDIGFEDYYLIHDLVCHKTQTGNPDQYHVREAMRIAYLYSIYNDGELDNLHTKYPESLINYLKNFDSIFTTNYDSNIDAVVDIPVYHIHGWFKQLEAVYDINSYRNQLPDAPVNNIQVDDEFYYLYSNALTTHCGAYKEFQLQQYGLANDAVSKLAKAYVCNSIVKHDVDLWLSCDNKITSNMGYAVKLKVENPEIKFEDNYHFDKLVSITGDLEILGLSPWNDFHIFEAIDKSELQECIYYYFSEEQCKKVKALLPNLSEKGKLKFCPLTKFWGEIYEK